MTWVLEQPVYIMILGGLTLLFLGYAWTQTGSRVLLHATLAAAAITAGLLILERLVETTPEQIERTLHEIADDVLSNDLDRILSHVYSGAPAIYQRAENEFPHYKFSRVDIKRNVEVQLDQSAAPPAADVTFNVVVDVEVLATGFSQPVARFVRLKMVLEDGQWRVADYAHDDFQSSMLRK